MMELPHEDMGDVRIVDIPVESLDAGNAKAFKASIAPLIRDHGRVVFDLNQVSLLDSSGLVAILSCLRQANENGGDLKLCRMGKRVRLLFELVRMHRVFDVLPSREEAVRAFQTQTP